MCPLLPGAGCCSCMHEGFSRILMVSSSCVVMEWEKLEVEVEIGDCVCYVYIYIYMIQELFKAEGPGGGAIRI